MFSRFTKGVVRLNTSKSIEMTEQKSRKPLTPQALCVLYLMSCNVLREEKKCCIGYILSKYISRLFGNLGKCNTIQTLLCMTFLSVEWNKTIIY